MNTFLSLVERLSRASEAAPAAAAGRISYELLRLMSLSSGSERQMSSKCKIRIQGKPGLIYTDFNIFIYR